jgi:2,3-bisphosphoglycerate-dependent phosphoglycerate mutase
VKSKGRTEATIASCRLIGYRVNVCFTSKLIRAIETATICLTKRDDICGALGTNNLVKNVARQHF